MKLKRSSTPFQQIQAKKHEKLHKGLLIWFLILFVLYEIDIISNFASTIFEVYYSNTGDLLLAVYRYIYVTIVRNILLAFSFLYLFYALATQYNITRQRNVEYLSHLGNQQLKQQLTSKSILQLLKSQVIEESTMAYEVQSSEQHTESQSFVRQTPHDRTKNYHISTTIFTDNTSFMGDSVLLRGVDSQFKHFILNKVFESQKISLSKRSFLN